MKQLNNRLIVAQYHAVKDEDEFLEKKLKSYFWSSVYVSGQLISKIKEPSIFQLLIPIREVGGGRTSELELELEKSEEEVE